MDEFKKLCLTNYIIMEKILATCAIICALAVGLSWELLEKKKVSKKFWRITFKLVIQVICAVSILCTSFSLHYQQSLLTESPPLWMNAVISIATVGLLVVIGNMLPNTYLEIKTIIKHGFKTADKEFLWTCFLIVAIILSGTICVEYFLSPVPIMLFPYIILILGGIVCGAVAVILAICFFLIKGIIFILKNMKSICKKYWKWLTD